jgi:hypothetical protein
MREPCEPFGPLYPQLGAGVIKHRKAARHGLSDLSGEQRRAYGLAVLEAIRGLCRAQLRRAAVPASRPNCASRTFEQTGADILKAVAAQNRTACLAKGRFDQAEANAKYEAAMKAKHGTVEWRQAA